MDNHIPRLTLIQRQEERIEAILKRPLMHGGDWNGVEVALLDCLAERDFALAWPHDPPGHIDERWCRTIGLTYRATNMTLEGTLKHDGVTEHEDIRARYVAVVRRFLAEDGLYPRSLAHRPCGGCHAHGYSSEHEPHCSRGCPTWPCDHTDGEAEVARWKAHYAKSRGPS